MVVNVPVNFELVFCWRFSTKRSTCSFGYGWYGAVKIQFIPNWRQYSWNAFDWNCVPLSDTSVFRIPKRANISRRIPMVDFAVIEVVWTISGHLVNASTTKKIASIHWSVIIDIAWCWPGSEMRFDRRFSCYAAVSAWSGIFFNMFVHEWPVHEAASDRFHPLDAWVPCM